jgi:hypothetical protein
MGLKEQVVEFLVKFPNSNARQIARALGSDKSSVNSLLYSNKNVIFKLHETSPPTWSVLSDRVEKIKIQNTQHRILNTSKEMHIDFQGGDWRVVIQIKDSSRNDPVVEVERTGPNSALIQVSSTVISNFEENSEYFPDVVMGLASSALAWEIAVQSDAVLEEKFNFTSAVRDIYLSLSVSGAKGG